MKIFKFNNLYIVHTEKKDGNQRLRGNRKRVLNHFDFDDVFIPVQKHTNTVVKYTDFQSEADGLFTDKKNVPVGVLTADCIPIVLFDGKVLSVLHAGWRGLFSGIIQNGLKNHNIERTAAYIFPSIRVCCYQVDEKFIRNLNISKDFYSKNENGIYLSLQNVAKSILKNNGISKIYEVPVCTACSDRLYSYRKGDFEDRIMTFAWFE